MTVAIIGGHGQIALHLTKLLNRAGTSVVNIIRNPDHFQDVEQAGGRPVICDIESAAPEYLAGALEGCSAVVFAAGAGPGSGAERKYTVDHQGSVKSAAAARAAGIDRFVQISFIGAGDPTPEGTEEVFAAYWDAKRKADDDLRGTKLNWTIVKPGMLTDDPATGTATVGTGSARGVKTTREDTAAFIALVLDDDRTIGHDLDVSTGNTPMAEALEEFLAR